MALHISSLITNPVVLLLIILCYAGVLFLLALWVEKRASAGIHYANNPVVYSLSLAIYCTSWSYYGSVGVATTSGMLYLVIFLGPTLAVIFWWGILRKLVRLKEKLRITSIADFLGARYGKSEAVAGVATLVAFFGVIPYIALQLKAVITTYNIVAQHDQLTSGWAENNAGLLIVVIMILFTIAFGVRRLDPTERHEGMVVAVTLESLVKLVGFLTAGIFVTYSVFNGFGDIFTRLQSTELPSQSFMGETGKIPFVTLVSYLILAMSSIMFLPRQFHVGVVENHDEKHIRMAMWLFPLYLLLINIFVFPIAAGGLLSGLAIEHADFFVLNIPLLHQQHWLALLVFIGGLAAATSMIMISTMTLSTMMTNHFILPLVNKLKALNDLKRYLLQIRWVAVASIICGSFWFQEIVGSSYSLVSMGIISFVAILQLAPATLGGIYWRRGNQRGALLGMMAGFVVWFYTLVVPIFVKGGLLTQDILSQGPWQLSFLRPQHLFIGTDLEPISHAVIWSMFVNIGIYYLGSVLHEPSEEERETADIFLDIMAPAKVSMVSDEASCEKAIALSPKLTLFLSLLSQYFSAIKSRRILGKILKTTGIGDKKNVTILELAEVVNEVEKTLSGMIGSATAHRMIRQHGIFTPEEAQLLRAAYGEIMADLNLAPDELKKRIDYFKDRELLLTTHAEELTEKVILLQEQIEQREKAEDALKEQLLFLQDLIDALPRSVSGKHLSHAHYFCRQSIVYMRIR